MSNPANNGQIIGRLTQDIKNFTNSDGSVKQLITIAVDDNFKSGAEKQYQTNYIQLENFVPAGNNVNGWDMVHKGDLVAVQFRIDAKSYEKDGVMYYPTKIVTDGFPTFLEPRSVTEARANKNSENKLAAAQARIAELEEIPQAATI